MPDNGWDKYSMMVLSELKQLNSNLNKLAEKFQTLSDKVAKLEVKAGFWGLLGGLIPSMAAILYIALTSYKG